MKELATKVQEIRYDLNEKVKTRKAACTRA
jgi:hypothetical protein